MVLSSISFASLMSFFDSKFCVSITNRDGLFIYVNKNFCDLSGYSEEELIGQSYSIVNPDYDLGRFMEELEQFFTSGEAWQKNIRAIAKDGSPYWVNANIIPILGESGQNLQFLSMDSDITTRELTKEKYKETQQNLRNIENALDYSPVSTITNAQGVITYVNEKFCELSQYTSEELIGKQSYREFEFHPKSFFKEMWERSKAETSGKAKFAIEERRLALLGQYDNRSVP